MCSHFWIEHKRDAIGYWQKRDCPGDGVYFRGTAEKCVCCPAIRFVPEGPGLRTVDCERDENP